MSDEHAQASHRDSAEAPAGCPCPACGAEVGQAKFCPECGTEIRQGRGACSSCGHRPEAETNFCPECGAQMP